MPLTVADLLRKQAVVRRDAPAIQDAQGVLSFGQLDGWACRIAQALLARGVGVGDRIAVLAENRREYIGLQLAAAKIGAIVACLNWRLADGEAAHCLGLVSPRLVFVSQRHAEVLARIGWADCPVIGLDAEFDGLLAGRSETDPAPEVDAEQGLVILYTSGTTGLPKGAVISQRAMVARAMCFAAEYGITAEHAYVAWSPLFHMAATDFSLATLMLGGKVIVHDGLDIDRLCATIEHETIGWLVAMPGMIDLLIEGLKRHRTRPRGVRLVGAMADLVPLQQIAELTGLLGAPYINSFGATETETEAKKPEWFHVAQFPQASFRSSAIKATAPGRYEVSGQLTIKGRSQPLTVPVQLAGNTATGSFAIKRLVFGIGSGDWADTSLVADEVQVRFRLQLSGLPQ